jgi:phosphate-selective porin OprO/OprP
MSSTASRPERGALAPLGAMLFFLFLNGAALAQNTDTTTAADLAPTANGSEGPLEDEDTDQEQQLKNPRIVIQENLEESDDVKVIISEEAETGDDESAQEDEQLRGLKRLQKQLDIESSELPDNLVLEKTDRFMELSRAPLTYVQNHVPFLTKRNIIFFGRLELDYAHYSSGVLADDSGFDLRRFRLGIAGQMRFWNRLNYKIEFDLTDGENTLSDAYLSYHSDRWGTLRLGNQKVAQTLSGQTSSLSIPFLERPLPIDAFTLTRRLGLGWDKHWKKVGANITVFGRNLNEDIGSHGWAARGYFNPTRSGMHVIHVGGSYMQLSTDNDAQFRSRPESHVTNIYLVDTGVRPFVGTGSALGLELVGAKGPVTLRSEFYRTEWTRSKTENPRFKGWYAEASWFLTGEKAHYREGKFIRPNIESKWGAWEVAARFSSIDLNDQDIRGGTQKNLSVGVNWYSLTHWRFMANAIKVRAEDGPYGKQKPWIVQVRLQYYF